MVKKSNKPKIVTGSGKKKSQPRDTKKLVLLALLVALVISCVIALLLQLKQNKEISSVRAAAGGWTQLGVNNGDGRFTDNFSGTKVAVCRASNYTLKMFATRPTSGALFPAKGTNVRVGNQQSGWATGWWGGTAQSRSLYYGVSIQLSSNKSVVIDVSFDKVGTKKFMILRNGQSADINNITSC